LNFTDVQVLTLIRAYPGLNVYELAKKAQAEMNMGGRCTWTYGKIQKAVERLKAERKINGRYVVRRNRSCQLLYATV
jgi:hypothetical protein